MGNIPLRNSGQFINPAQKRGVNPNWNTQQYEYAKSIIAGFNDMGQQIGNGMMRVGKATAREETMKDAHSISLLKIRTGEDFSAVEKTIAAKEYKTVEQFDADWNDTILPQMDEAHEVLMQDADIVWNRQRIQPKAQRVYEVAREQFRVKARAGVEARVIQRRQENAAKAISSAGASANIPAISAGRDAAIAAGIAMQEVEEMTRAAMFEAFAVTQRDNMEQYGGVNSAQYKIAMHEALSTQKEGISERIRAILNEEDEKIFAAWKASDFSGIIAVAEKKSSTKTLAVTGSNGKKSGDGKEAGDGTFGEDWSKVRKAGIETVEATHNEAIRAIEEAKREGTITPEVAERMKNHAEAEKQNALRKVDADLLAQRKAAAKEQKIIVKSLIEVAAQSESEFLTLATQVQYSGDASVNFNEKLNWMRTRKDGEYDAKASRMTLLRIYANSGRFTDASDSDGSYRLSALALARKNCNAADYDKAISFLAGGDKDSSLKELIENGMFKVFGAVGLNGDDMGKAHLGDDEVAELAAMCGDVVRLAGNLPPAAFRHEIQGMCETLKKTKSVRERIRYMERYLDDATRDIESLSEQIRADEKQSKDTTADSAKTLVSDAQKKNLEQEAEERKRRAAKKQKEEELAGKLNSRPSVPTPGMSTNLTDIWHWLRN